MVRHYWRHRRVHLGVVRRFEFLSEPFIRLGQFHSLFSHSIMYYGFIILFRRPDAPRLDAQKTEVAYAIPAIRPTATR